MWRYIRIKYYYYHYYYYYDLVSCSISNTMIWPVVAFPILWSGPACTIELRYESYRKSAIVTNLRKSACTSVFDVKLRYENYEILRKVRIMLRRAVSYLNFTKMRNIGHRSAISIHFCPNFVPDMNCLLQTTKHVRNLPITRHFRM